MSDFAQLHQYVISAKDELRDRLGFADIPRLDFEIRVTGRTLGNDICEIKYTLGVWGESVQGNRLEAVIEEYLRRKGWAARHNALALPAPTSADDEIPDL